MKEIFKKIEIETIKMGLKVNEEKAKYLCKNRKEQNVTVHINNFESVERFKYLWAMITSDNDITEELQRKMQSPRVCT